MGVPFSVGVIWVVLFGIGLLVQFPSVLSCERCLLSMLIMKMLDFVVLLSLPSFNPVPVYGHQS